MAFSERDLQPILQHFLISQPGVKHLCVAYSGGMDSTVLLDACYRLVRQGLLSACDGAGLGLSAVHVNHGLNPVAGVWQKHCQDQCKLRSIPLHCESLDIAVPADRSPEDLARNARYRVFESRLEADTVLLMAHHQDDQAETLLLRLMRGAGPEGLAAIPETRPLGRGTLFRPLLGVPRAALQACAESANLEWVEDDSNADPGMDRNYLRNQIMPGLRQRWPGFAQNWQLSAQLCAEAGRLNRVLAEQDLAAARIDSADNVLQLAPLRALDPARQRNALRYWLLGKGCKGVGFKLLMRLSDEVLPAREDAIPELCWQGHELIRYRDRLFLQPALPEIVASRAGPFVLGDADCRELLSGNGELALHRAGGNLDLPAGTHISVRYRRDGEKCRMAGQVHKSVKQLMQEAGVPPWLRHRLPMIEVDGELVAIVGVGVCEGFRSAGDGSGWQLSWHLPPWHF